MNGLLASMARLGPFIFDCPLVYNGGGGEHLQ